MFEKFQLFFGVLSITAIIRDIKSDEIFPSKSTGKAIDFDIGFVVLTKVSADKESFAKIFFAVFTVPIAPFIVGNETVIIYHFVSAGKKN